MHPSAEPVLSMKRQVRQTRQERIPLRVISNEEGQQNMGPLNDNSEQKVTLDRLLLDHPEVSVGVVFATLSEEGVGIKLPEARVRELLEKPGFVPFRPFGRNRGKEFVQINHENPEDYQHDKALFEEAMRYVFSISADQKELSPQTPMLDGDEEEQCFRSIAALLARENSAITLGKMMSSLALHYQGKVFAFYYRKKIVFRLGRDFQPETFNIQHYRLLAPFKTKPPMVDWFEIASADQHRWEELSRYALQLLREQ